MIIVAATSNSGANEPFAFPANQIGVLSANAADLYGSTAAVMFNSPPIRGRTNYSALGIDIKFPWSDPVHKGSSLAQCP